MAPRQPFETLVAALHDAALDAARWPAASALLDEAVGIKGNALLIPSGPEADAGFLAGVCLYRGQRREDLERQYLETYHRLDYRVPRLRRLPAGRLVHVAELLTEQELETGPAYNEFCARSDGRNCLHVRLRGADDADFAWILLDPVRTDWQAAQRAMIRRLLPHVRHFVNVCRSLSGAQALGVFHRVLLDHTGVGVIFLDRRGRIVETNDRARDFLGTGSGLRVEGGRLGAWLPTDDVRIQRLLAAAFGRPASGGSVPVRPGLTLHVHPLTVRQLDLGAPELGALVLIDGLDRLPGVDAERVGSALGLTPAESRIAVLLAAGRTVPDIAAATGRAPGSVRTHLKSIHHKLGVSRRADLVRLVLSAPAGARSRHRP